MTAPRLSAVRLAVKLALLAATLVACATQPPPGLDGSPDFQMSQKRKQAPFMDETALQEFDRTESVRALEAFEGARPTEYLLGPSDEITVQVFGRPELSGPSIVGPYGDISMPVVGAVRVEGLTPTEAANVIGKRVAKYYLEAPVSVRIDRYVANQVLVLGRVAYPGALHFDRPPTLLDALARAGALPVGGIGADKAALNRCAIVRGRDQIAWIDLKSVLNGTNPRLNIELRRGDLLYIPDADDQLVYVIGQVHKPGAYRLTPDMSFLDALNTAGGPTNDASYKSIYVVRPRDHMQKEVSLYDLIDANPEPNVVLEEGDIIYVPQNGLAALGYVFQQLSPITGMALVGAAVAP